MLTAFPLHERADVKTVAANLAAARTIPSQPARFAIVATDKGAVVVAGDEAPRQRGRVDLVASAPGGSETRRVVGDVVDTVRARLLPSLLGRASFVFASASAVGMATAFASGHVTAGVILLCQTAWGAAPAAGEYMLHVNRAGRASRALRAVGVDLAPTPVQA